LLLACKIGESISVTLREKNRRWLAFPIVWACRTILSKIAQLKPAVCGIFWLQRNQETKAAFGGKFRKRAARLQGEEK
jgi:hypothetical protein